VERLLDMVLEELRLIEAAEVAPRRLWSTQPTARDSVRVVQKILGLMPSNKQIRRFITRKHELLMRNEIEDTCPKL
jgi:hypothetical protein